MRVYASVHEWGAQCFGDQSFVVTVSVCVLRFDVHRIWCLYYFTFSIVLFCSTLGQLRSFYAFPAYLVFRSVRCVLNCPWKTEEELTHNPGRIHNRIKSPMLTGFCQFHWSVCQTKASKRNLLSVHPQLMCIANSRRTPCNFLISAIQDKPYSHRVAIPRSNCNDNLRNCPRKKAICNSQKFRLNHHKEWSPIVLWSACCQSCLLLAIRPAVLVASAVVRVHHAEMTATAALSGCVDLCELAAASLMILSTRATLKSTHPNTWPALASLLRIPFLLQASKQEVRETAIMFSLQTAACSLLHLPAHAPAASILAVAWARSSY